MEPVINITYILLFALGCVGSASIGFLHKCLKTRLTAYLFILFLVLLSSIARSLLFYYTLSLGINVQIHPVVSFTTGFIILCSTYILIYLILTELKNPRVLQYRLATIGIILIQISRTLIYYFFDKNIALQGYPILISIVSLYLFYTGYQFLTRIKNNWNQAVKNLIRRMGILTMIFAPVSTIIYLLMYVLKIQTAVSLDFIFLGIWSLVSVSVVLHYLTTMGTIPSVTTPGQRFLDQYGISPREKEVLELILKGYSNKQIGDKLFISFTTARTHVSHIFEKTSVKSRVELVSKVLSE